MQMYQSLFYFQSMFLNQNRSLEVKHRFGFNRRTIFLGSSGFLSDKVCHLRLGFLGNVTRRYGEDGGLLKQSNGSNGGTVGA